MSRISRSIWSKRARQKSWQPSRHYSLLVQSWLQMLASDAGWNVKDIQEHLNLVQSLFAWCRASFLFSPMAAEGSP
eukprot:993624-Pelagomonas_calceolata.AAC.1